MIADAYDEHYLTSASVVEAVALEIRRLASEQIPGGDPNRHRERASAAQSAVGRYRALLDAAIPRPDPVPAALCRLQVTFAASAKKKRPEKPVHAEAHRGESESIHAAIATSKGFVTCDSDAHAVATRRGVKTTTFVGISRGVLKRDPALTERQVLKELQRTARHNIDIGEVVNSVLDLR